MTPMSETENASASAPAWDPKPEPKPDSERQPKPQTQTQPQTLDRAGIAARVPHAGTMCLLHSLQSWDETAIACTTLSHLDPHNPLREAGVLPAVAGIEYAAQAMALHAALQAAQDAPADSAPTPGFLASVRAVRCWVLRLDTLPGALTVQAHRMAGDGKQAMYAFSLHDAHAALLVEGRATVILSALPSS